MANHKLTLLGHPAFKKIQLYLQNNDGVRETRRLAYADGVVAMSGYEDGRTNAFRLARELYDVELNDPELVQRFNAMLRSFGHEKAGTLDPDVCAEAHLWMTLTGLHLRNRGQGQQPRHLHPHPKHLHVWVYEIDGHNRPKEDSPCPNCRQWVRGEFLTVNGTS